MRIVSVKLPEAYIEAIDELVRMGLYTSRSEAIRAAIRELLKKELWSSKAAAPQPRSRKRKRVEVIEIDQQK